MSFLPATTYAAPPRLGRGRPLKTISETEECIFGMKSDSEGDESDRTIIARPAGLDAKLAMGASTRSKLSHQTFDAPPSPVASSPCSTSSSTIEDDSQRYRVRESYASSDAGTVFSEDSCPSLAGSNDTTFYTNSSRNSAISEGSARASRNRYPSILIPRGSWHEENAIKEVTLAMSPAQKILLSPQALSALPQHIPSRYAPPSLGEGSSLASNSPGMQAISSAPITPDMRNIVPMQGESWGTNSAARPPSSIPIEIAIDEEHSIIVSPHESIAQSNRDSVGYSTDWSDVVVRFPRIPGATPQENTPIEPDLSDLRGFRMPHHDDGVQLPNDALNLLQTLTRSYSPVSTSHQSDTSRPGQEMRECGGDENRPKSAIVQTPLSEYSFSQLSIPSPGGFFNSLQTNSRATWCLPGQSRIPSMPSSAVAENFYDIPFKGVQTVQTILEVPDREVTDGPPTARQAEFAIPAEYRADSEEDDDLYGAPSAPPSRSPELTHEYEASYEDGLKRAAEASIDRTSNWLSAQTTYLSALRESNPMNDPAEYIPQTPHPLNDDTPEELDDSPARKAVRFLEAAVKVSDAKVGDHKSSAERQLRDSVFLEAFEHCSSQKGRQDAFLQAAARLESVNSGRLALPLKHVHSLLNTMSTETLQVHSRPRYRGPFSQNPRATGNFHKTPEQLVFADAERKQLAMDHILPAVWATEAQRKVFYNGRLLACPAAVERLASKSGKSRRVLDLAGAATGSWAWSAARRWSHVKIVTVQSKAQSELAAQWPLSASKDKSASVKPENPTNHKVVVVPELWKLPFSDNYFDVISARTLYMFLRARPVPNVPSINEWDLTLKECMRVLKPGGVLDFVMLDSHIANNNSENKSKHSRDNSEATASISPTAAVGQGLISPPATATFGASGPLLNPTSFNFGRELKKQGYEADGGVSQLADRLSHAGFTNMKRQWIGLPLGRTGPTHDNVIASYETIESGVGSSSSNASIRTQAASTGLQRSKIGSVSQANGRSRTPFPPAPRPISEVSSISRIIEQYANVEAVHGPVGSTADVSDMAGLLGTLMWEEWLVRHRLEALNSRNRQCAAEESKDADATFEATNLLYNINDILAAGYAKGACFRAMIGWARKPSNKTTNNMITTAPAPATVSVQPKHYMSERTHQAPAQTLSHRIQIDTRRESSYHNRAARLAQADSTFKGFPSDDTPTTATTPRPAVAHQYYGNGRHPQQQFFTPIDQVRRDLTLDTRSGDFGKNYESPQFTQSAVDRGEVGTIPMMIIE